MSNATIIVEDNTINVLTVGIQGPAGPGTPVGGTTGQVLAKNSNADFDTEWETIAGTGTVTSVTYTGDGVLQSSTPSSPVTTSGTISATLKTQVKNTVLLGPASGSDATPTFRTLVGADLPNPSTSSLGGVQAIVAVSHQFITSISSSGVPTLAQPSTSDISGLGTAATHAATDFLLTANNLSDVVAATARTNLGLGTAATQSTATFLQTANNLSDVTAATARTNLGLGSAATHASTDFLLASNNLSDVTASTARTNLGLGTAATQTTGTFLQTANNLSDVTAATAATNLGLGTGSDVTFKSVTAYRPIISVSGTTKTLALGDANTHQLCSNASSQTITIPPHSSVAFAVGTELDFFAQGAGQVILAAGAGVTIQSKSSNLKLTGQYSGGTIKQLSSDTWSLVGDLSA